MSAQIYCRFSDLAGLKAEWINEKTFCPAGPHCFLEVWIRGKVLLIWPAHYSGPAR